jgi:hypothetical protein
MDTVLISQYFIYFGVIILCMNADVSVFKKQRIDAYVDVMIGFGLGISAFFVFAVCMGLISIPSGIPSVTPVIDSMPGSITKGEEMIVVLLSGYAGIWGMRLLSRAITTITTLNAKITYSESTIIPLTG